MWARKPSSLFELLEPRLVGRAEQPDGAVVERLEQVRVDAAEQRDGVGVPAPPQVVGERLQRVEPVGQARQNGERCGSDDRACRHPLPGVKRAAREAQPPGRR